MGKKKILGIYDELKLLKSEKGKINFLMNTTGLSRDLVETIQGHGSPWPLPKLKEFAEVDPQIAAALEDFAASSGGYYMDSDNFDAIDEIMGSEAQGRESQLSQFKVALKKKDLTLLQSEIVVGENLLDHLEKVAILSGVSLDTVCDFYCAVLAYLKGRWELETSIPMY